jgi:quercetin dioxygenase-like cupin family protein
MAEKPLFQSTQTAQTSLTAETIFAEHGVVSRTLFATSTTRVVLFAFAEGQTLSEHSTPRDVLVQILSGRCEFTVDGKAHALVSGDLLHLPPSEPHAVRAVEKFSMLLTLSKADAPAPTQAKQP